MPNRSTTMTDRCGEELVVTTKTSNLPVDEHVAETMREHADNLETAGCTELAEEYRAAADQLDP